MTDAERMALNTLYSLHAVRHSMVMRNILTDNAYDSKAMAAAIHKEMMAFFDGNILLVDDDYDGFVKWFTENTTADIHRECSSVVMGNMED
jgi:hypothetical protein